MGSFSIWHWLIVIVVIVVLFGGGGKMSRLMGDLGKGLRSFQKNLKGSTEDGETNEKIDHQSEEEIKQDKAKSTS